MSDQPHDPTPDTRPFKQRVEDALASGMPIPDFPDVSPLAAMAMANHELINELTKEEMFSRGEALYIITSLMTGNPGQGPAH